MHRSTTSFKRPAAVRAAVLAAALLLLPTRVPAGPEPAARVVVSDPSVDEFTVCSDFIVPTTLEFEIAVTEGAGEVEVGYRIEAGTASPEELLGSDGEEGTVTVTPDRPAIVSVDVSFDDRAEEDETVLLRVTGAEGADPPDEPAVGTIIDDDDALAIRYAGPSRVETAVAMWPPLRTFLQPSDQQVPAVLVAGDRPAEAVVAAALGERVLMTAGPGLHPAVAETLSLGTPPTQVTIVGGEAAVPPRVETDLAELGVDGVERIGDADPATTAAMVAGAVQHDGHAYLIAEDGIVDGVVVAGLASAFSRPVLLTGRDNLPAATLGALRDGGFTTVTIVGGQQVVSPDVEATLRDDEGLTVNRLAGEDRYGTAVAVAEAAVAEGVREDVVWIASGRGFADVATAGAASGTAAGCYRPRSLLMLVDGLDLDDSPAARDWLAGRTGFTRVYAAGGAAAITEAVVDDVVELTGVSRPQ